MSFKIEKIHHVGYRCRDAKKTVDFYRGLLNMDFIAAISEPVVPTSKLPCPYFHLFFDAGMGNVLAFFDIADLEMELPKMDGPMWARHIALQVKDVAALEEAKASLVAGGVKVSGPTDHNMFTSIYFSDPDDNRVELTAPAADEPEKMARLRAVADDMLEEWTRTNKTPPRHAAWIHEKEFAGLKL